MAMDETTVRGLLKEQQDCAETLVQQQAATFQLQFDALHAELQAALGQIQGWHARITEALLDDQVTSVSVTATKAVTSSGGQRQSTPRFGVPSTSTNTTKQALLPTPAQTQTTVNANSKPLAIKWISLAERQERLNKGLCFNCDNKWTMKFTLVDTTYTLKGDASLHIRQQQQPRILDNLPTMSPCLLQTWTPQTDCCKSWDGIACGSHGRVVNVSRSGVFFNEDDDYVDTTMSGIISPFLSNLTFLQLLDLSNLKDLRGPIPPEFGKLSRLTHLFLGANNLSGILPDVIFRSFKSLREITLTRNKFSGQIPSSIGHMISITLLAFSENNFSGIIPETIGKLKNLEYLYLSNNNISGLIPESLGLLSKLERLELDQNKLFGTIPASIGGLVSVRILSFFNNELTGVIPPSIGKLRNIQTLGFANNKLSGKLPASIGHLIKLNEIFFYNNQFNGSIPTSFGNLSNLQYLSLPANNLTGRIPSQLAKLGALQILDLSRNKLTGRIPSQLARLQNLSTLDLSFNPLNLVTLPKWFSKLNLGSLMMAKTGLQGSFPWVLLSSSIIWQLDLSSNCLTGELPPLIGNMSNLMFLNLSNNGFSNAIPSEFKNLSSIKDLDLHSNNFSGDINFIFKRNAQPAEFGFFSSIDLSYNSFSGLLVMSLLWCLLYRNIPKELLNMESLKELDVSGNRLAGEIPVHNFSFPTSAFLGNPGLCGAPLPPCNISL
ncbi:leucine-rich repeat protein [Artemisia annua]|uniref:Leucine-rich repeat protein n=1 Tax=Artemisia annua TaxID=35608 RepID=A0A2U1NC96_ARTAN|nr:leucine-rich repeat protein [Artemisia annua]